MSKACSRCKTVLAAVPENFAPRASRGGTLSSWCRTCAREHDRRRDKSPERLEYKRGLVYANRRKRPAQFRAYNQNRRQRVKGAAGSLTPDAILARVAYYGWCCRYCLRPLTPRTLTLDHRIPLARGGTNWPANIVPACKSCNSSKNAKTEAEFLASKRGA